MTDKHCILAIDQGTTSTRAIVFDSTARIVTSTQMEFPQHYPNEGWVEHDPEDIWNTTLEVTRKALEVTESQGLKVVGIGITNQRETSVVWDKATGKPIYNAIVWQDRRTSKVCADLKAQDLETKVNSRTGLLLDPYFSATKVSWILDHVDGARQRAENGELAFGTIDSFLIWRLTGGKAHVTDPTNACRTNLYNIHTGEWDPELLQIFQVPAALLPEVKDCSADFGATEPGLFGHSIAITGVAGDQQAATIGQCCFEPGSIKSTYGTGCFVVMNTGSEPVASKNRLLTTIAYQLDGKPTYAIEGSIFVAGAAVQWLRDGLGIIASAKDTEKLASGLANNSGIYLVPAFTGLGVPYWNPDVRGAIFGLTRATGPAELVRATLESVCYLTSDLFAALAQDGIKPTDLRVDGGMVANDWLLQFLANVLDLSVSRPAVMETTALGAAYLAGRQCGVYGDFDEFTAQWRLAARFEPNITAAERDQLLHGWHDAVRRVTAPADKL
ncbi:glycerol kinase GlpK [Pseudomaricurvus alcaniphilus]|uniref:glycerol kinase GlpK n=1 Tax=Pseudomaricurvus alcaniphilus TaxID=1166482 RepID=UPI00140880C1|nr:glycerol kinase GlpK [Pseudomaricurvus alcaniphilus]NHN35895.1 glycerol kinase GlpK [Pseudomaricurvus alcaniphilus]